MLLLPVIPTRGLTFWSADDQKRAKVKLSWRHRHLTVHGKQIHSMTYDDLCEDTLERLATFSALKSVFAADAGTGAEAASVAKAPAPLPPAPSVPGESA
jgi:hypothetical protein